ncbi:aminobutyraldehyde dehydrogenase [Actinomyces slackii]|uniref:Gamma-aminobutyraldehyde dehydrogenase n=1 Tax=Actinomyces slackii TaxID=52774 RepID=A0A3S4UMB8_9ACTO|nr:aminobutyraldehyde dehydrogenase [Actinomyces slackii]VEG73905.1 Gamma-aminobutyraldehyde dehydrogenase [Actinomyces slackii]
MSWNEQSTASSDLITLSNVINGQAVPATTAETVEVIDPRSEQPVALCPLSGQEDVDAAYQAAQEAFASWRLTTPEERQALLLALADAVEAHADELVAAQQRDTGQLAEAIRAEEVLVGASQLRFFAGAARIHSGLASGEYAQGANSQIRREPIGVVGQIVPWNYPLLMLIWKVGPALAAGNTVVLKPSASTPLSATVFARIANEILPPGVFNLILGSGATGRLLSSHPTPALVALTGSVRAGSDLAEQAARNVVRVHLELGGKAPVIVFADADIESAAEGIAAGGLFNAGQDCTAATRVLVEASIAEEFTQALVRHAQALRTGPIPEEEAFYGPLNNERHFKAVSDIVDARPAHAQLLTGGHRVGETGYYYAPTVISGLRQDDDLIQTEVFGPVLTVQEFTSDDEALAMANGVDYALASSIWTADHRRVLRFSRDLDFGCVWVNTHILLVAEMPHGGYKRSGYGKDLSVYGVEDYTRIKHVMSAL